MKMSIAPPAPPFLLAAALVPLVASFSTNFDNGTLAPFVNVGTLAWKPRTGETPTDSTGPSTDHTTQNTSGLGTYVFCESSSPNSPFGGPFVLEASLGGLGANIASFWYSMNGVAMGELSLNVSNTGGASWETIWRRSGEQGRLRMITIACFA